MLSDSFSRLDFTGTGARVTNAGPLTPLGVPGLDKPLGPDPGPAPPLLRNVPGGSNPQLPPVLQGQGGLVSSQSRLPAFLELEGHEGKAIVAISAVVNPGELYRTKLGEKLEHSLTRHAGRNP